MAKRASKAMVVSTGKPDKKNAVETSAEKPGAGKGKKYCPHCSKIIGAAKTICPECGKAIKKKKAGKKKGKSGSQTAFPYGANAPKPVSAVSRDRADPFSAAANLIEAAGSLSEAKIILERLAAIAKLCQALSRCEEQP